LARVFLLQADGTVALLMIGGMRNPVEKVAITRIYRDTFNLWKREIFPLAFRILKSSENAAVFMWTKPPMFTKREKGGNDRQCV